VATAPTFVTDYQTAWDTTTSPKSVSVTTSTSDLLLVFAGAEPTGNTFNTPSGGGLTYTSLWQSLPPKASGVVCMWKATAPSGQTFTLSMSVVEGSPVRWGFWVARYATTPGDDAFDFNWISSVDGSLPYGNVAATTDLGDIAFLAVDGAAVSGTSRAWGQVDGVGAVEKIYNRQINHYTVYAARWATSGLFNKHPAMTAPANQLWAAGAVQVKGSGNTVTGAFAWGSISYMSLVGGKLWQGEFSWASQSAMTLASSNITYGALDWSSQSAMTLASADTSTRSYIVTEHFGPNDSPDVYQTWFGVELRYVDGYDANPTAYTARGGFFSVTGGDPDLAPQFEQAGLKLGNFEYGDPGYHVLVRQQSGCPGFVLTVALEYLGPA
jgi:hypothetical protein